MSRLDDFAFLRGKYDELYHRVEMVLSLYEEGKLPFFCEACRRPLERALKEMYIIAGISQIPDYVGDRVGNLKILLPEEIFPNSMRELFDQYNKLVRSYSHDDSFPSPEKWNIDAEECYRLMRICFEWFTSFEDRFKEYFDTHEPINYEKVLSDRLLTKSELPQFNSAEYTQMPDYDELCLKTLDIQKRFWESLKLDLSFIFEDITEKTSRTFQGIVGILDGITFSSKAAIDSLDYLKRVREFIPKLIATRHVYSYFSIIHPILFNESWSPSELESQVFAGATLTLEQIYAGLISINLYASKAVIKKIDANEFALDNLCNQLDKKGKEGKGGFIESFNKLKLPGDKVRVLHNIGNFRRFLVLRDRSQLLKAKERALSVFSSGRSEYNRSDCETFLIEFAKSIKASSLDILAELFDATNNKDWQKYEQFEQKYITDILETPDYQPLINELKKRQTEEKELSSLTDRQRYIRGLRQVIEKGKSIYKEMILNSFSQIDKDFPYVKEFAFDHGLIRENQDAFNILLQVIALDSAANILDDDLGTGLEKIAHQAEEAVSKGVFCSDDPYFCLKAIVICADRFNNETQDYTLIDVETSFAEAIRDYENELAEPEISLCLQVNPLIECNISLLSAVVYVVKNYPLGLTKLLKEDLIFERAKYLKVRTFAEVSDFVKKMTPFGQRRLLIDLDCPIYCEEDLLKAILSGDQDSFKQICSSEKLKLVDDLAIVIGYIITVFEEPFEALYNMDSNVDDQSDVIFDSLNTKILGSLGLPESVIQDLLDLYSNADIMKKYLPFIDVSNPEDVSNCAHLVSSMVSLYHCLNVFDLDEIEEVNKLLDNPNLEGLGRLTQYYYYCLYEKWPSKIPILLSPEEQKEIEDGNHGVNADNNPPISQGLKEYHYTLPLDLFEGKVDTVHAFIPGLKNDLKDNDVFEPLFNYILRLGGITSDAEAGALLRVFTGYPVENANDRAKWETDYHILLYLVKYVFTPKKSYVKMSECIDIYYPSDDERQKAESKPSSYAERIGGDDAPSIIETLHRLSDVFPKPEEPVTD